MRGEVKPFLKAYYNGFSGLADRETYTFWEHYFYASPHKTHEEGWFLMQTRKMLYMEEGQELKLLPGIPRAWLEHGKQIELQNVACYFGLFSLKVESLLEKGIIRATLHCDPDRLPQTILCVFLIPMDADHVKLSAERMKRIKNRCGLLQYMVKLRFVYNSDIKYSVTLQGI